MKNKRLISLILALVMIFSLIPLLQFAVKVSAAEENGLVYTVTNGLATITGYTASVSSKLTIPETSADIM